MTWKIPVLACTTAIICILILSNRAHTFLEEQSEIYEKEQRVQYRYWVKENQEHSDMPFEDWTILQKGNLLPGKKNK